MKVSKSWLDELVDLKVPMTEVERLLPLRTISTKEITSQSIELDMKGYNRSDLLSMRGVAYEVSAITDSPIKFSEIEAKDWLWHDQTFEDLVTAVKDQDRVPVYCLAKINNLKVESSPKEWIEKLTAAGMRSVNNLTDITNLIMLEYGQPLHAFDASQVKDHQIVVRPGQIGEKLTTLDGKEQSLEETDLVIADMSKALGLAGVMGGQNSEVTQNTTTILLEAAIFDPVTIRKTANRLGLNSEASKRFVHGLSIKRLYQALDAAIKMYQQIGGELVGLHIDQASDNIKEISLTDTKTSQLIGVKFSDKQIADYLQKLHIQKLDSNNFSPPYWRLDLAIEEDLIEEVARMYGYENIPATPLSNLIPQQADQSLFNLIHQLKGKLVSLGLTEVQTYSFVSSQVLESLDFKDKSSLVKVANPISSETEYLRQNIWPNLAEVATKNIRQGLKDMAIFEIGRVFEPALNNQPKESYRLSLALVNETDNPIEELLAILLNLPLKLELGQARQNPPFFHPNRHQPLYTQGKQVGGIAEVHPRVVNKLGATERLAVAEIDLKELL